MSVSTADKNGRPSCRIVLLKAFDERGFVFYTNYKSRKGEELMENPYAALTFIWHELGRQVRIEAVLKKSVKKNRMSILPAAIKRVR